MSNAPASPRFERPRTVHDAVALLAEGAFVPLAGGTDVYPAHVGRPVDRPLLDLGRVAGLRGIRADADAWHLGATTTWTDVLRADLPPLFEGLRAAAREVGGVQIQNTGTLAGNVCNASPAADGIPALLALDAEVVLASTSGERRVALADFVIGPRRTARAAHELVVALRVPRRSDRAVSSFRKLGGRRHLVISIAMVAATVDVDADGTVVHAAVAVGSCSAVALRLHGLEARLVGTALADRAAHVEAADLAPLAPIDDIRATAAYRLDAALTLVRRALADLSPGAAPRTAPATGTALATGRAA